jgi:2-amino-4-hydroxy-6-hydroxymethyldihydropteridine diphosphokinase
LRSGENGIQWKPEKGPATLALKQTYHLGLGSNLGDPAKNLDRARRLLALAGIEIIKASAVYRTEPVDVADQPWFHNQVLEVRTELRPREILAAALSIEKIMKRVRTVDKGPRTIDIDILLAGEEIIDTPELAIPHPRLAARNFVLVPLAEIAPRAVHPVLGKTIEELAGRCPDRSAVRGVNPLRGNPRT